MSIPIVLRFASLHPRNLAKVRMHGNRAGGDLTHINPAAQRLRESGVEPNEVLVGNDDWVEGFKETMRIEALTNRRNMAARARERGKEADARRIERRVPTALFAHSKGGPLREGILTANAEWFVADKNRQEQFKKQGFAFLNEHFGKSLIHCRYDIDEGAPHFHFVVAEWKEEKTRTGAVRRMLRPSQNPILRSYETAQDLAGAFFAKLGLHRGAKRRDVLRLAKEAGIEAPPKRRHKSPADYKKEIHDRELSADLALSQIEAERQEMEADFSAREVKLGKQAEAVRADLTRLKIAVSRDTLDAAEPSKSASIQKAKKLAGAKSRKEAARKAVRKNLFKYGGRARESG